MTPTIAIADNLVRAIPATLQKAVANLLGQQDARGYWCGELTADTTLESDYILLQLWMHPPVAGVWNPPTMPLVQKAAQSILSRQLPDGGFNIYQHGPTEVSATVKAYFALKLSGLPVDDPRLARARECILARGGMQAANSYVKINLSLFDLYPREDCPTIPPELMLLGKFIYQMSSWTRAIAISISIVRVVPSWRSARIPGRREVFHLAQSVPSHRPFSEAVGTARTAKHPPKSAARG